MAVHICLMTRTTLEHSVKGGMEHHADIVSQGLAARGYRITAITTQHPDGKSEILTSGVRAIFLPHSADRAYATVWWRESADAFDQLHREDPVDIIWSQEFGAYGVLCRPARPDVPCVAILHGTALGDWRGKRREWGFRLTTLPRMARFTMRTLLFHRRFRITCRRSDAVICVSPQLAKDAVREFGIQTDRVIDIPNGVNTDTFAPDEMARHALRSRLEIPEGGFVLLTAGRLEQAKGHHLAFQVAATLLQQGHPVWVIVAGSGPDEVWLRQQAESRGLAGRIRWLGYVPHEEMPGVYSACDAALVLSLHTEAFPYAVVEAMSCARPVAASRVGGIPAAIAHGQNGFLVAPGDANSAAKQVAILLQDGARRAAIGQAARQTVLARFTVDRMIFGTESVFLQHARRREVATR
jgi:glycosyltransferase involved in cell wall biosynthesis